MVIVPRASTHLEYTDIAYVLPASRYGQALSSAYPQAWLATYLQHDPAADATLLADSLRYLEPDASGTWQPIAAGLQRTTTSPGSAATDDEWEPFAVEVTHPEACAA